MLCAGHTASICSNGMLVRVRSSNRMFTLFDQRVPNPQNGATTMTVTTSLPFRKSIRRRDEPEASSLVIIQNAGTALLSVKTLRRQLRILRQICSVQISPSRKLVNLNPKTWLDGSDPRACWPQWFCYETDCSAEPALLSDCRKPNGGW